MRNDYKDIAIVMKETVQRPFMKQDQITISQKLKVLCRVCTYQCSDLDKHNYSFINAEIY